MPDLVVITGDFVMGYNRAPEVKERLSEMSAVLKMVSDRFLTLSVLGNHDYWLSRNSVVEMLGQAGITNLNNAVHTLERAVISCISPVWMMSRNAGRVWIGAFSIP